MGAHDTAKPAAGAMSAADAMDAMHEKGIKAFPPRPRCYGNRLLEPKLVDGVKVYELTASEMQWETSAGQMVKAMAYNGQVPGPQIRVREGDRVRVILKNQLTQSTAIHFHGLELPSRWTASRSSRSRP
jgi:FtsP/CotA-like multicopper oxidase with cupredoxin domain